MPDDSPLPLATLGRRLASLLYEALLLGALLLVAGFALLPWITPTSPTPPGLHVPRLPERALSFAYYFAVGAIYFQWFWSGSRRTLPMKTWHMRLVESDGRPLSRNRALARYAAAWVGPLLGIAAYGLVGRWGLALSWLNFAWAAVDPDRQFLHDRLVGTRIVRSA